ncbi:MAG: hypothetical protein JRF02_02970 [Deltaproteobacteria bacterium]|nr:hypothetical protein [Deltaproteobacteria bacterium]
MKKNCWEFKLCGLGPGGDKVHEFGVCPAAKENKFDGIHNGKQGGRVCWVVEDTLLCGGCPKGKFINKYSICMNCEFYKIVKDEEGEDFQITLLMMKHLKNK